MLTQVSVDQCAGKTIRAIEDYCHESLSISFTDDTFIHLRIVSPRYPDDSHEIRSSRVSLDPERFAPGDGGCVRACIYTDEEEREARKVIQHRESEQARLRRLAEFKRLRNEFDPPTEAELAAENKESLTASLEKSRQILTKMYEPR